MSDKKNGEILVVDDTPANLRLLSRILRHQDYQVRALPDGVLAIQSAVEHPPELILLDIMLPGLDGYEVCRRLKAKEETRDIPILFISALQGTDDKIKGFEVGGADYITKPFQEAEVLARVATHLELSRARKQLKAAKTRAEAANRGKSAFLGNMSHELRTPLNAVLGYAQILQHDGYSEQVRHAANGIYRSGAYLSTLIDEVLELANFEAGKLELVPEPFQPQDLFHDLAGFFGLRAEREGVAFVYTEDGLPRTLSGDARRIRQIATNLIDNAFKYTERGQVRLAIAYGEGRLTIEVADAGPGIPSHRLEDIFKPFVQADALRYQAERTGLALAIMRALVEAMDGEIEVDSVVGRGTRFIVRVPLPTIDAGIVQSRAEGTITGYRRTDGVDAALRILIADSDAGNRAMMRDLFITLGFEVDLVDSGEQVLQYMHARPSDILITDLVLNGIDGLETISLLKQSAHWREMPVLVVSGSSYDQDREASRAVGALVHLDKPLQQRQLFEAVGEHLPLEWSYVVTVPAPSAQPLHPLPPACLAELTDLVRFGKLTQTIERLADYRRQLPSHPSLAELDRLANNFDVAALQSYLKRLEAVPELTS